MVSTKWRARWLTTTTPASCFWPTPLVALHCTGGRAVQCPAPVRWTSWRYGRSRQDVAVADRRLPAQSAGATTCNDHGPGSWSPWAANPPRHRGETRNALRCTCKLLHTPPPKRPRREALLRLSLQVCTISPHPLIGATRCNACNAAAIGLQPRCNRLATHRGRSPLRPA
jgi:hypothetical protein